MPSWLDGAIAAAIDFARDANRSGAGMDLRDFPPMLWVDQVHDAAFGGDA